MAIVRNAAKERLDAGEIAVGVGLRQARTVDVTVAMKTCGFDWLFIDLEHNSMSLDTAVQIAMAASPVGIAPLVRIPAGRYDLASRALDGGAQGIFVPHINTAAEAREAVSQLKYPPVGQRSIASPMPQLGFRTLPLAEAMAEVNGQILVVAMLETPGAVLAAEEIAAVPGIDALHVGANDPSSELGVLGQYLHTDVERAFASVVAACRRHGKAPAMGGIYTEKELAHYVGMGVRMVLAGNDLNLLMAAATARATLVRQSSKSSATTNGLR
jgi:2-keto-3-deoxy-L-rhamnonate aldolase RhmA